MIDDPEVNEAISLDSNYRLTNLTESVTSQLSRLCIQ